MTDIWYPHVTVATIVENEGKFLTVKETSNGNTVLNQPAGHLEANETLFEAAIRETLEETAWHVELKELIGLYLYTSPHNSTTYFRVLFSANAISREKEFELDDGIIDAQWLTLDQIKSKKDELRSPMVLSCIEDYLAGKRLPLDTIRHLLP